MLDMLVFNPPPDKTADGLAWAAHMAEVHRTAEKVMLDEVVLRLTVKAVMLSEDVDYGPHLEEIDHNNSFEKTQKYRLSNFKRHAETCNFLMKYHINEGEQLYNVVKKISDRHAAVATAIKEKMRRLDTLEKHLFMNEYLKLNKSVYRKYTRLDPKKQNGYKAKHAVEIQLYEEARDYFKAVMNGRKDPLPIKSWEKEWETLTAEKYGLVAEYYELADEIKAAETVIRGLKMMEQDEPQRTRAQRVNGMEL